MRKGPNGDYAGKIFTRYVVMNPKTAFSIGNIVSFRFPKAGLPKDAHGKPVFDRAQTAESIRKAMGFKAWKTRTEGHASVFEAPWVAVNRYVRIYMWETPTTFSYSIASFRPAYAASFALESELIQRYLAHAIQKPQPWMTSWLRSHGGYASSDAVHGRTGLWSWISTWASSELSSLGLIHSAYAQGAPCAQCTPTDIQCLIQAASCNEGALGQQLGTLNNDIGNLVKVGDAANANWANSNAQVAAINQNWTTSNQNWQQTNEQYKRTNDILQNFMKPENAFLFAAASSAGAAVGALAVNIACDTLSFVGSAIIEAITHAKDDAERLEAFRKAREVWEKASSAAADLEKTIDNLLDARKLAKDFGLSRENLITRLGVEAMAKGIMLDSTRKRAEAAYESGDQVAFCRESEKAASLTDVVSTVQQLKDKLQSPDNDNALCSVLIQKLNALRMVEGQLQEARLQILVGEQAFMDAQQKQYDHDAEAINRLNNPLDHASLEAEHKKRLDDIESNHQKAKDDLQGKIDRDYNACVWDVDNGDACDKIVKKYTEEDLTRKRQKAIAERDAPGTSDARKAQLNLYLSQLYDWEVQFNASLPACRKKNKTNIGGQIPIIGVLFRGSGKVKEWCSTFLNGTDEFIDYTQRKEELDNAYYKAIAQENEGYAHAIGKADVVVAHDPTFEAEMSAWTAWFNTVRDEQGCLNSDLACETDTHGDALVSRYRRLEKKVPRIEQVCHDTEL